jgi:hypothetical protein
MSPCPEKAENHPSQKAQSQAYVHALDQHSDDETQDQTDTDADKHELITAHVVRFLSPGSRRGA